MTDKRSRRPNTSPNKDVKHRKKTKDFPLTEEPSRSVAEDARYLASLPPLVEDTSLGNAPLPELLLPAGSPDALCAAIEAGADAVYFGASRFSARAYAVNFNEKEARDAIALCRAYGVKSYAAVNTRIRDGELEDCADLVGMLYYAGVDAVITADLGLCALLRERYGDIELHASTQLTPVFKYDADALSRAGFSRMVAPRELDFDALSRLCRESSLEIEAFVHGAHCVSLSGQCLMSALIGGRSANRGECAQPCRLPYRDGDRSTYLLSLSDMCYAGDIPALIASGVSSLKVEGRKKDEDYVYGVGKLYRALLDERRSANEDEIAALGRLFERGFTDGYLRRDFSRMTGVRRRDALRERVYDSLKKRVKADAELELYSGRVPRLTLTASGGSFTVAGDSPAKGATGTPLTEDRARAAVAKLGQTPYELGEFIYNTDGETWIAASELNELRRRCAAGLLSLCRRDAVRDTDHSTADENADGCNDGCADGNAADHSTADGHVCRGIASSLGALEDGMFVPPAEKLRIAELTSADQLCPRAAEYFHRIYLPYTEFLCGPLSEGQGRGNTFGRAVGISLPPYMTDAEADRIGELISPGDRVLAHTVGQIAFARSLGAEVDASFRLNVFNAPCAAYVSEMLEGGVCVLSTELLAAAMGDISRRVAMTGAVVYGKLPVMYTVRCMLRDGACPKGGYGGQQGKLRRSSPCERYFTDRTGARFFVRGGRDCANTVYNSVPVWMADRAEVLDKTGAAAYFYIFSDEDAVGVERVIDAYSEGRAAGMQSIRRIK